MLHVTINVAKRRIIISIELRSMWNDFTTVRRLPFISEGDDPSTSHGRITAFF
jgi:hypothetical protein